MFILNGLIPDSRKRIFKGNMDRLNSGNNNKFMKTCKAMVREVLNSK